MKVINQTRVGSEVTSSSEWRAVTFWLFTLAHSCTASVDLSTTVVNVIQLRLLALNGNKLQLLDHLQDVLKIKITVEITFFIIVIYFFDLTAAKVGFPRKKILLQCHAETF